MRKGQDGVRDEGGKCTQVEDQRESALSKKVFQHLSSRPSVYNKMYKEGQSMKNLQIS